MSDLEIRRKQIEEEQEKIQSLRAELSALQREAQTAKEKVEAQKERVIRAAQEQASEMLRKAKEEADQTIARINKLIQQGAQGGMDMSALEKERAHLRETLDQMQQKAPASSVGAPGLSIFGS